MTVRAGSPLVVVDLDLTLIYSSGSLLRSRWRAPSRADGLVQVEQHDASGSRSYVSPSLRAQLDALRAVAMVVPVTTRTRAQFERVAPLGTTEFDPSVCANGAVMLVSGEPDDGWASEVEREMTSKYSLESVGRHLDGLGLSEKGARFADGHFCYLVVDDAERAETQLPAVQAHLAMHGWVACLSGRKLYALPAVLTKAVAVERLARRVDASAIVAVGDSILDLPMLEIADHSIAPAHADDAVREVVNYVTDSSGPSAGVECLAAAMKWLEGSRAAS